ncbi:hypothetical protein GF386_01530 [Candidatus Pacearchaeota archaeon]|nr:hypothetical protein [Candidatus Pacearchaeota archaeon]MBD3282863.1 hypothetical protein [Candidatus Pacearchaeota archaeon]
MADARTQVAFVSSCFRYRRVSLEESVEVRREIFRKLDGKWVLYSVESESDFLHQVRVRIDRDYEEGFYAQSPRRIQEVGFDETFVSYSCLTDLLVEEGERTFPAELVDFNS